MRRFNKITALALAIALVLCGMGTAALAENSALSLPQLDDCFTQRDLSGDWDASAVEILLTGDTAETRSHAVSVEGGQITILDGGVYQLSGTLDDGTIVVDVKDDERVQLVLNGVHITCSDGPAIRVLQADKVFITLAEGTENSLSNGGSFAEEGVEAVIYSDEDLTFNGTGSLEINSPAGDGIDGKDDVKFASGSYIITASGRGIDANDSIRIAGGDFTITSGGDAIRAKHAANENLGYVYIWGGTFEIVTGGGSANGPEHAEELGFGGMMGGPGPRGGADGDGAEFAMPGFDGENGEMPERPEFEGGDGEMPERPEFEGGDGEMPERPEFDGEDGEMPEPPQLDGEAGERPNAMAGDDSGTSGEAEDTVSMKGIKASGDIVILGGEFSFDTADDALHANRDLLLFDGSLTIASGDDGVHAGGTLTIAGGALEITESYEGLEGKVIAITGGQVSVTASDDGLNANDSGSDAGEFEAQEGVEIAISGGTLYVNAEGDGIDSNGDLTVTGGTVVVSGPQASMNGALDYNGVALISGGTVLAAGASGMAENFSEGSAQAAFLVSLSGEAGEIVISDAGGEVLFSAAVEKPFATAVFSCPGLEVGETYTVTAGGESVEITLTDTITGEDEGGMMGFGRM